MKIRIRIPKRVPVEYVLMHFALFFVASFALLEHMSIPIPIFSAVKLPLLYAGGICMLAGWKPIRNSLRKKKFFYIIGVLFVFCLLLCISAFSNRATVTGETPYYDTGRLILYLVELFLLMIWIAETGRGDQAINFLFWYVLVLVVATDFLLLTGLVTFESGLAANYYLIGTEFTVSYMHMNLVTLAFIRSNCRTNLSRRAKFLAILGIFIVINVSVRVDCLTGLFGFLVLLCLFALLNTRFQKRILKLSSPVLLLTVLIASVVFPFIVEKIVALPVVRNFLITIADRSETLTGRLDIFAVYAEKMQGHWLWGFGFGNGNIAAVNLFGYANAQNAILHWTLQVGVVAVAVLVMLFIMIFRQFATATNQKKFLPMVALIYVYVIMGFVETTFSMSFLMWMALIFMYTNQKQEIPEQGKSEVLPESGAEIMNHEEA